MKCPVTVTDHMNFEPTFKTDGISCKYEEMCKLSSSVRIGGDLPGIHPPIERTNHL